MNKHSVMGKFNLLILWLVILSGCQNEVDENRGPAQNTTVDYDPVIVLHGGAGSIVRGNMTPERESLYQKSLRSAIDSGYIWLSAGIPGVDVVERVIRILEHDTLFNAGRGSVVNMRGEAELDASIMDGTSLNAGAVCGVQHIEHPISLARRVMDSSAHVMLAGNGAEEFAQNQGFERVDPAIFLTDRRRRQYRELFAEKMGTVGVVVRDIRGNLAAGTSTGGTMMKEYGRVGDSPIIGAGTYADNNGVAVSCTGQGEFFIRHAVAYQLNARVRLANQELRAAGNELIHGVLAEAGAQGGLIAIDRDGRVIMPFNTAGMFRAMRTVDSTFVGLYGPDAGSVSAARDGIPED